MLDAKTNIRDYHGKIAAHYWSGSAHVFQRPDLQSGENQGESPSFLLREGYAAVTSADVLPGGRRPRGTHGQRHVLPSLRLSRSRSQGQLSLDFARGPAGRDTWDLQV